VQGNGLSWCGTGGFFCVERTGTTLKLGPAKSGGEFEHNSIFTLGVVSTGEILPKALPDSGSQGYAELQFTAGLFTCNPSSDLSTIPRALNRA